MIGIGIKLGFGNQIKDQETHNIKLTTILFDMI